MFDRINQNFQQLIIENFFKIKKIEFFFQYVL